MSKILDMMRSRSAAEAAQEAEDRAKRIASKLPIRGVRREPTLAEKRGLQAVDKALDDVQNTKEGLPSEHPMPRAVRFQEPERPKRTQADIIRSIGQDTANAYFTQVEHVADQLVRLAGEQLKRSERLVARAEEVAKRMREQATGYASEVASEYDKIAQAEEALERLVTRFPSPPKTVDALPEVSSQSDPSENEGLEG